MVKYQVVLIVLYTLVFNVIGVAKYLNKSGNKVLALTLLLLGLGDFALNLTITVSIFVMYHRLRTFYKHTQMTTHQKKGCADYIGHFLCFVAICSVAVHGIGRAIVIYLQARGSQH
jgi:NADH:ubiquinone oxidoreductase subunit K